MSWVAASCDPNADQSLSATADELPAVASMRSPEDLIAHGPRTLSEPHSPSEYWDLPLQEVIRTALANSEVMRNLGARVIKAPTTTATATTVFDPAISESDPLSGPQAALSAFDAQFTTRLFASHSNQVTGDADVDGDPLHEKLFHLQDIIFHEHPTDAAGLGVPGLSNDFHVLQIEVAKKAATGTRFSMSASVVNFDFEGPVGLNVNDAGVSLQVLHPLLKGGGIEYNRIAGGNALPGRYNGVLLARINTDISLADFELAVTDFVHDVQVAYWDLQFAYRDLDAKIAARDAALEIWRTVQSRFEEGDVDADDEAAALEQYYIFKAEVQNALVGVEASRSIDLPARGGVYRSERRLRELMGLPVSDDRLIRPAEDPVIAQVTFDWPSDLQAALAYRVELRRQKWIVKRRELELTASHNEMRPSLDLFARYRASYIGSEFLQQDIDGGLHQASVGIQFGVPIGRRQGYAAVRNAELQLARERAILADQELQISHELSAAITEADRAYHLVETTFNRLQAVHKQIALRRKRYEEGDIPLQLLLDTMLRSIEAESAHISALIDYNVALSNVQLERGTLLRDDGIQLHEGSGSDAAHSDAWDQGNRWEIAPDQIVRRVPSVSPGLVDETSEVAILPPPEPIDASHDAETPVPGPPPTAVPELQFTPAVFQQVHSPIGFCQPLTERASESGNTPSPTLLQLIPDPNSLRRKSEGQSMPAPLRRSQAPNIPTTHPANDDTALPDGEVGRVQLPD